MEAIERDCIILFKRKRSKTRWILDQKRSLAHRQVLGSVKRVYGAAFSGYPDIDIAKNEETVRCFVRNAEACILPRSKSVTARYRQICRSAAIIVRSIRDLLNPLVDAHLRRLSKILPDKKTSLSWNIIGNNCQRLVNHLLKGKDFEYFFPRLQGDFGEPAGVSSGHATTWPRYLLSFGDCLDGVHGSGQQINSLISLFSRRKRNQCDLIEFIELALSEKHKARDFVADPDDCWHHSRWRELLLEPFESASQQDDTGIESQELREVLWDLPRDTFSILQSHLLRPVQRYRTSGGIALNKSEWILNRLRLFRQMDIVASLTGSLGGAILEAFKLDRALISKVIFPKSRALGTIRADEVVRIIRPTKWTSAYFIANRHAREVSGLADAPEDLFEDLSAALMKYWDKIVAKHAGSYLVMGGSTVLGLILRECFEICGQLSPMGSMLGSLTSSLAVLKRKLHGNDDWMVITLGNSMTIMLQNLKKSKNFRKLS